RRHIRDRPRPRRRIATADRDGGSRRRIAPNLTRSVSDPGDDGSVGDWTIDELIAPLPDARRATAEALRKLVKRVVPGTIEAVRPGWRVINYRVPNGRRAPVFGWLMPEPKHVHLGF